MSIDHSAVLCYGWRIKRPDIDVLNDMNEIGILVEAWEQSVSCVLAVIQLKQRIDDWPKEIEELPDIPGEEILDLVNYAKENNIQLLHEKPKWYLMCTQW